MTCIHYWILEEGVTALGRCKGCGRERNFTGGFPAANQWPAVTGATAKPTQQGHRLLSEGGGGMTEGNDICAHVGCEHPRYGHPVRGQSWVAACPNCWADVSDEAGRLLDEAAARADLADHGFEEPA